MLLPSSSLVTILPVAAQYQLWDAGILDYGIQEVAGLQLRGPGPVNVERPDIAFVGAAQTFGRYRDAPFPSLVARALGVDILNFGVGGKGPGYFASSDSIIAALNRAQLVVVQVMSARSTSNSQFHAQLGSNKGIRVSDGSTVSAERFYTEFLQQHAAAAIDGLFRETKDRYVEEMRALLSRITPPKILLWLSTRRTFSTAPRAGTLHWALDLCKRGLARAHITSRFELLAGSFPHLVDDEVIRAIRPHADLYLECVTSAGLPELIHDRRHHRLRWNNYYPSATMHRMTAALLIPACKHFL